ncbi:hypothetical protein Tco_0470556, partial [Tanacetum coccineum]
VLVHTVPALLLLHQPIFLKKKFSLVLLIYSLFAKQTKDLDLLHEDLEQIDDVDIEQRDGEYTFKGKLIVDILNHLHASLEGKRFTSCTRPSY